LPSTQQGKQIQASLNYFGFDAGSADGQLSRKSKVAVSQCQAYFGYPVSGQLSPYGQDLLISSYQRAMVSGYLATQQAMAHPEGSRGILKIYLAEWRVPQPDFPQQPQPMTVPINRRWALVIGVDGYQIFENLQKAHSDAQAISRVLTGLGFEVRRLYDPGRRDINGAVSTMANQIDPGDEVLFYFAGHGVEVDGRNFLLLSEVPMINYGDKIF